MTIDEIRARCEADGHGAKGGNMNANLNGAGRKRGRARMDKIKYYFWVARWMWVHRAEPANRSKWRRMLREITALKPEREG